MHDFSPAQQAAIRELSQRQGFSEDATASMLRALHAGRGRMAQFDHPEFGGAGQWMRGGMTMVSDMFNATLKARVERLCGELSRLISSVPETAFEDAAHGGDADEVSVRFGASADRPDWWPSQLGHVDSTGSQNGVRYAYFAAARRLAIDDNGNVTVYDTLDHRINGAAQQQSRSGSFTFSSQHGVVRVATLPIVTSQDKAPPAAATDRPEQRPAARVESRQSSDGALDPQNVESRRDERNPPSDIIATIERLAELRHKGIVSEAEFGAKKAELLNRL